MNNKQNNISDICIISISDTLNGAEQVLFKIAKFYSVNKNRRVKILFYKSKSNLYWEQNLNKNVEIVYLNGKVISLFNQLKKHKFDKTFASHLIMNAYLGFCRTIGLLKTRKLIVRESTSVFVRYSGLKLLKYKLAYYFGYRKIDLVICQTQNMLEILKENTSFLFQRANVKVIPNPFDFPDENLVKEFVNIPENSIVSAGRLIPEKGFDVLIKSFAKITNENPEISLVILGEGSERSTLESLILDLNLSKKVTLFGHVNNVYPYFNKAKICVVSSIREGFPNVLLQMMSQNEKVISTDCAGDIREIEGLSVIEINNVNILALGIQKMLMSKVNNRKVFNEQLNRRTIESFINQITNELN